MGSRNTSVTVSRNAYKVAANAAAMHRLSLAEFLASKIRTYPITKKTIEDACNTRSRQVALARSVAEELDAKIKKAGGSGKVTRSEVLDFILQCM